MGNNKNPKEKRPGEKEQGTFHFNPGNMSGKTSGIDKNELQNSNAGRKYGGHENKTKRERADGDR